MKIQAHHYVMGHALLLGWIGIGLVALLWHFVDVEDLARPEIWSLGLAATLSKNLVEYVLHRWPMHKRRPWCAKMFQQHTCVHHRRFTSQDMAISSVGDLHNVLPTTRNLVVLVGVWGSFVLAVSWISTPSIGAFVGFCLGVSALVSETLHTLYHLPTRWIRRMPRWFQWLQQQHAIHHEPKLMRTYNFNVALPLCDLLFGTLAPKGS